MRKNILICLVCVMSGMFFLSSCHYEEMPLYEDIFRINFLGTDKDNKDTDDPSTFKAEYNFGTNVGGDTVLVDTVRVKVRLLGDLSGEPLKITLAARKYGEASLADVEFQNPYELTDSAYRAVLNVVIKRPVERDKEFKAQLYFDYANSDVQSGIDSLQTYLLTVKDELTLEMCGLDEDFWETDVKGVMGAYSNNKLRFCVKALKSTNFGTWYYGYYYIMRAATTCREELQKYNDAHPDDKLKDENGNLISFDPE